MKFGICSEIYKEWNDVERAIAHAKAAGYDGMEIAPFTLANDVTRISAATRASIVRAAEREGMDIIGIHWVLVGPEGLYLNHPDTAIRDRTSAYIRDLARFSHDIGGKIMVFGSPKARNVHPGLTYAQAFEYARASFASVMDTCEACGVTICMEPLSAQETDFCLSAAQALELVRAVDHPNFQMMLDTKAMTTEDEDRPSLIKKYAPWMKHYHANDPNLNGPGWGELDFAPIFGALKEVGYKGYVSVEVFNFEPGPEAIAARSLEYMRRFA